MSYLCQLGGFTFTEAMGQFRNCRKGGVYRDEVIQFLFDKFAKEGEQRPEKPEEPAWMLDWKHYNIVTVLKLRSTWLWKAYKLLQ